jgi:hypothetical protein
MPASSKERDALSDAQVQHFVQQGFVRLDEAFSPQLAAQARDVLWRDTGCDPADPATWTKPVIRLGMYSQQPFIEAANTAVLHAAFDRLVGSGRWLPCGSIGTFPVRFPSEEDAGDTGWHVDASFGWDQPDFMDWRVNITSKGRALLMLFLFSDVGPDDAPTRIAAGSHRVIARSLADAGEDGMTLRQLVGVIEAMQPSAGALATGPAGTVYLCHPFLVHSAQRHQGKRPRFLAQPPLLPREPLRLERSDGDYSAVEVAIRQALNFAA